MTMNVGHVILGRSWLYDKDLTIFGQSNMCHFEHEGKISSCFLVCLRLYKRNESLSQWRKPTVSAWLVQMLSVKMWRKELLSWSLQPGKLTRSPLIWFLSYSPQWLRSLLTSFQMTSWIS